MRWRLRRIWSQLRSSYWFIPMLMTLGALGLSVILTVVDGLIGPDWIHDIDFLYANKPSGARALLSTVAGSMIGVAGVTFSITIVAVVYASGQYGPRLLTNFMRDTGNQVTLGTFIATFIYCLMVLRTVRDADESAGGAAPGADVIGPFVPHIAILAAILLTLASVAVFIYFIHHVPHSMHVSRVIAGIGQGLGKRVDTLFPEQIGKSAGEDGVNAESPELPERFYQEGRSVRSEQTGYIQTLEAESLVKLATQHDLVIRSRYRPGDFAGVADVLLVAWPADRVTDDVAEALRNLFSWGTSRTALQDVRFLINELVEIAARALSPGVNDPFTAITCLDWLGAALAKVGRREIPTSARYDEDGALRVVVQPTSFADFVEAAFGQLRPYVAADRNALFYAFRTIGDVSSHVVSPALRQVLRQEIDDLLEAALETLGPADANQARVHHLAIVALLEGNADDVARTSKTPLAGGTG